MKMPMNQIEHNRPFYALDTVLHGEVWKHDGELYLWIDDIRELRNITGSGMTVDIEYEHKNVPCQLTILDEVGDVYSSHVFPNWVSLQEALPADIHFSVKENGKREAVITGSKSYRLIATDVPCVHKRQREQIKESIQKLVQLSS